MYTSIKLTRFFKNMLPFLVPELAQTQTGLNMSHVTKAFKEMSIALPKTKMSLKERLFQ